MRWVNGKTREQKKKEWREWHRWFAWYPVNVGVTPNGRYIKAWMETVERKIDYHLFWDDVYVEKKYRMPEKEVKK